MLIFFLCKTINARLTTPSYLGRADHIRKFKCRKQRTDVAKYSFVNRTIVDWNSLPAGKTAAEIGGMLQQAFDDDALGKSQVYEWFSRLKSGNMSTEDMPRPGCPSAGRSDENTAKIKHAIDEDRRKTIDEVSEQTNLSWSKVQRILTEDLHMRRVSAKFVPCLLTDDQRENRVRVCRDLKSEVQNDPNFLKRILTGDESWCYGAMGTIQDQSKHQASGKLQIHHDPRKHVKCNPM
ncbi:hypothetical protein ANN_20368 [Periplaneta americana]|uniref:Mos1 transposase HTH domain-containing protein n=1 Tax=Periplaneta americana TaxID=6978 RepID=A0ABQ8SCQ5_PERAM|nr:hypothetical protein ANN_20368 [Periplaneta americana]